jgi:hypothetical protein
LRGDCCHGVATGPLTGYVAGRLIRDVAATAASAKDEGPVRARTSAIPDESRSEPAVKRGFWRRSEPAARSPSVATLAFICRSTADCQDCTNGGIGVAPKRRRTTPSTARWVSPGFVALQGSAMDRERACNPRVAGRTPDGSEMRALARKEERQEQTRRVVLLLATSRLVEVARDCRFDDAAIRATYAVPTDSRLRLSCWVAARASRWRADGLRSLCAQEGEPGRTLLLRSGTAQVT